ncbi:hypothetical protein [Salinilacihabitans rarus]|uniref:hypothetical protein n=1 Tax=Salinilacihabitans rarus TaxID=2961596 RepID=UPI0020C849C4|nr:hypothetical protein [Salinilacihabitans rarus]
MARTNDDIDVKVDEIHQKRTSSMSRRRLMQALTGLGMTVGSAVYITPEDVKGASADQVPIVKGHTFAEPGDPTTERVTVKENVPADWYNNLKRAERVQEALKLEEIDEVSLVETRPPEPGGENAYIYVEVAEKLATESKKNAGDIVGGIPERSNGIEIEAVVNERVGYESEDDQESSGSKNEIDVESHSATVNPGQAIYTGNGTSGTAGGRVYYDSHDYPRFITCHHLWHGEEPDRNNVDVYDSSNVDLGYAINGDCKSDYLVFAPESDVSVSNRVSGGIIADITGEYSQDYVNILAGEGESVEKQGKTTGYTTGELHTANGYVAFVGFEGCDDRSDQVRWGDGSDFDDGDSGSVAWYQWGDDYDENWAVSLNAGTYWDSSLSLTVFGSGTWHFPNYSWG